MPFGETLYEEHENNKEMPYKFNGKEKDEETGLYYYSARYYDLMIAKFLTVDPMWRERPNLSVFNYCSNNPIIRIDPNGMLDGDYYDKNGNHLGNDGKNDNKVYVAEKKNADGTFKNATQLSVNHSGFQKQAATIYDESSIGYGIESKEEMFAIASVHQRNKIAYGANSDKAKEFLSTPINKRTGAMRTANAALINALTNGFDYSYGADQWDGAEQAMVSKTNMNSASNGKFMFKMNVMGWSMNKKHYDSWKLNIENKWGAGRFTVPQEKKALHNYGGMKNAGKIRLNSTAQYGLTIFWKTINN